MKEKLKAITRYEIYDYENPDMKIGFHLNITPYTEKHQHNFWEIMLMIQNDCINVINGKEIELREMEIQILRPDDIHYCKRMNKEEHLLLNIEIKTEFFEDILKNFCFLKKILN